MAFRDTLYRAARKIGLVRPYSGIAPFALEPSAKHDLAAINPTGLAAQFYAHQGRIVHKWTHYIEIYEKHFSHLVGSDFRMLEIGVFKGGSLDLWRNYFGANATIFGIDIDPKCSAYVDLPNQVRIGSQADPAFLRKVVAEMGGLDLVLDDGSHFAAHQRASFEALFPLLSDGGLYVIEDTHTAYWPGIAEGGYKRPGTAIELTKRLIDDLHGHYHGRQELSSEASKWIPAIHVYDSVVVIEKKRRSPPVHIKVGAGLG